MERVSITMQPRKKIALVAHDHKKRDLLEWVEYNKELLAEQEIFATGTTGRLVEKMIDMPVIKFQNRLLGGDQQIGAKIAEGEIDFVVFFWDPPEPAPRALT